MPTSCHFENISDRIKDEMSKAKHTIHFALAYFTDSDLLNMLWTIANTRMRVQIHGIVANNEFNIGERALDFGSLDRLGGNVYILGSTEGMHHKMHNKYCIIDSKTVITGSYNWTNNAQSNFENILVIEDKAIADRYLGDFYRLCREFALQGKGNQPDKNAPSMREYNLNPNELAAALGSSL